MRLEKIKISGFKSFVDPTNVVLPSNLVGVIGPNGCGKSNVIDAVRWVMGESSAKMLRGESMADVIFNGSSSRKPVGAASIELVFDNSDGTVKGEYAQFNQISIRRKVTRDGQSAYFLNSARCRRRDITDIFLGTGLGPRSYSIIEQGMISRFIEAKPEELRAFLEEAAGISKYKERRKETENRIAHTRENLERLTDLRDEVAKQLQHLERQAATAEKYKTLKSEERQKKAELLALRLKSLDEDLQEHDKKLSELETQLQSIIAEQREIESGLEKQRESQHEANDNFNQIQGQFYAVGADIARLEESIQYTKNARSQQKTDLEQVENAWQEAQDHSTQDQSRLAELQQLLEKELPEFETMQARESDMSSHLENAEKSMQDWQQEWDDFNHKATEPAQVAQIERTKINHIEQQEQQFQRRLAKIQEEHSRLDPTVFLKEIEEFSEKISAAEDELETLESGLKILLEDISQTRQATREKSQELDTLRTRQQTLKGRLSSLEALQQDALGKHEKAVNQWLDQNGLADAERMLEKISVDSQWQTAVETVMAFFLQSVCIDDFNLSAEAIGQFEKGQLALFDGSLKSYQGSLPENSLLQYVQSDYDLSSLLLNVSTADSLSDALANRSSLEPHQSLITSDGVWVSRSWIRINRVADEKGGMLAREDEINRLREDISSTASSIETLEQAIQVGRENVRQAEQNREQQQKQLNSLTRQLGDWRGHVASRQARVDNINNRIASLDAERGEIEQQITSGQQLSEESRSRLHEALHEMETHGERREQLVHKRDELRSNLQQAREQAGSEKHRLHEAELRIESMKSSVNALNENLSRMTGQLQHLQERRDRLSSSLNQSEQPLVEQENELAANLKKRLAVEEQLSAARQKLADIDHEVRELEQGRLSVETKVQQQRDRITQSKMRRQETLVRHQNISEQISETGNQAQQLLEQLPENANASEWQEEVEKLERRITRLGPINLAAIDEFKEQSERMVYLDRQNEDITASLETLENAIKKIDRETRTRFKETYDTVDAGLKELFPKLFGGGHAYLQLTGEDVLDAGVSIMARPPGKRNSSIHLLSGGEKALTAVALVFAIFLINPAPFCMLDEVDAPLDDANVGRFCKMVKEMSEKVQFVFITHNKVTMEIANQLMGVTMHEPGVSRLVTVDIDEAAKLAVV